MHSCFSIDIPEIFPHAFYKPGRRGTELSNGTRKSPLRAAELHFGEESQAGRLCYFNAGGRNAINFGGPGAASPGQVRVVEKNTGHVLIPRAA